MCALLLQSGGGKRQRKEEREVSILLDSPEGYGAFFDNGETSLDSRDSSFLPSSSFSFVFFFFFSIHFEEKYVSSTPFQMRVRLFPLSPIVPQAIFLVAGLLSFSSLDTRESSRRFFLSFL